ncbi:MAG: restriction endonuclease subunit S [Candidatus Omnitrophota bacterium]|nr:MAG: restriction endonuclease subunit S [Candidatus Omnitrophota bacterium]
MENKLKQGWVNKRIEEICRIIKDKGASGEVPYLEIGNIDISKKTYIFTNKPSVKGCKCAKKNDILISRVRPTRGAIVIVNEDELAVSSAFTILRNNRNSLTDKYLWFYLAWNHNFLNYLGDNCTGTMYPTVGEKTIINYLIPLAPLNGQKRIVNKLDMLLAKLKECRIRLEKIPLSIKRFRQSVLAATYSGRLTAEWRTNKPSTPTVLGGKQNAVPVKDLIDIPNTWRWIKLSNVGEMSRGKSRHRPRNASFLFGGPYPFIQTGDIAQSGGRILKHKQTYSEDGLAQSRLWPAQTVCITIAANIAESAVLTYPACFPDSVVGIITDRSKCLPEYLEYFIRITKSDLATFAPATAQKNINIKILSDVYVPLPPVEEQKEIINRVQCMFKIADRILTRYAKAKSHIGNLSQSILAKAFRGELVEQDPNDEPAN